MAECYKTIEYPDRKAIAALYAAGAKAGQIAKEIGVAPRTIYAELKRGREGDKLDKNFRPSYGFRGHFVPGHWDGKSFVYQPKDPQGGMFVHSLIPGHYTLERAVNATKRTQNARLQRRFEQELKKRGYMKYFK